MLCFHPYFYFRLLPRVSIGHLSGACTAVFPSSIHTEDWCAGGIIGPTLLAARIFGEKAVYSSPEGAGAGASASECVGGGESIITLIFLMTNEMQIPSKDLDALVMSSWPARPAAPASRRSASMDWKGKICSIRFSILRERSVSWITRLEHEHIPGITYLSHIHTYIYQKHINPRWNEFLPSEFKFFRQNFLTSVCALRQMQQSLVLRAPTSTYIHTYMHTYIHA